MVVLVGAQGSNDTKGHGCGHSSGLKVVKKGKIGTLYGSGKVDRYCPGTKIGLMGSVTVGVVWGQRQHCCQRGRLWHGGLVVSHPNS